MLCQSLTRRKTGNIISYRLKRAQMMILIKDVCSKLLITRHKRHVCGNFQKVAQADQWAIHKAIWASANSKHKGCLRAIDEAKTNTKCWSKSVAKTWKLQLLTTATNDSNQATWDGKGDGDGEEVEATTRFEDAPQSCRHVVNVPPLLLLLFGPESRRSTKSIPGILLPRSCLPQSSRRGGEKELNRCSDWSAAVYGLMQPIQMQLLRNSQTRSWSRSRSRSWSRSWSRSCSLSTGNTNSRRPLTIDPKPKTKLKFKLQRPTHTAFWKLENYFHCLLKLKLDLNLSLSLDMGSGLGQGAADAACK